MHGSYAVPVTVSFAVGSDETGSGGIARPRATGPQATNTPSSAGTPPPIDTRSPSRATVMNTRVRVRVPSSSPTP